MPNQASAEAAAGTTAAASGATETETIIGHRRIQRDLSGETSHTSVMFCDGIREEWRERYGDY